jgi:hypothetical protein
MKFISHKIQGISWLAQDLLASQEGPCFVELVSYGYATISAGSLAIWTALSASEVIYCRITWDYLLGDFTKRFTDKGYVVLKE